MPKPIKNTITSLLLDREINMFTQTIIHFENMKFTLYKL